jgi:hypothetical protein
MDRFSLERHHAARVMLEHLPESDEMLAEPA